MIISTARITALLPILILVTYGCRVPEEVTERVPDVTDESPDSVEELPDLQPGWYDTRITSRSDSMAFYGYAHSVAADSADAAHQAKTSAEKYLRFEVDRYLESLRSEMEIGGNEQAGDAPFAIRFRNIAANFSFPQPVSVTIEQFLSDENRYEIYVKHRLNRNELHSLLEKQLSDQYLIDIIEDL